MGDSEGRGNRRVRGGAIGEIKRQWKEEINLVIIDSGINRDSEKELPKNVIIKHYNSKDNDNNHADLVLKILLDNLKHIETKKLIIHDIIITDSNRVSVEALHDSLEVAKNLAPDIINLSLGVSHDDENIRNIIEDLTSDNVTVVAAAGNKFGMTAQYPARYDNVISVGSLDKKGGISSFSARKNVDEYRIGEYNLFSGTSFSTPIVLLKLLMISLRISMDFLFEISYIWF